jgi:hypothetical protein
VPTRPGFVPGRELFEEGCSFLKKRTKKLLDFWSVAPGRARANCNRAAAKSFSLLFFKKEVSHLLFLVRAPKMDCFAALAMTAGWAER